MACGCNGGGNAELWEVVYADGQISTAVPKSEATSTSSRSPGSYIRRAGGVTAAAR
jgi:hypothetical protein